MIENFIVTKCRRKTKNLYIYRDKKTHLTLLFLYKKFEWVGSHGSKKHGGSKITHRGTFLWLMRSELYHHQLKYVCNN